MAKTKEPKTQKEVLAFLHKVAETEGWIKSYNGRPREGGAGCMCGCGGKYSDSDRAVNGMFNRIDRLLREDFDYIDELSLNKGKGSNYIILVVFGRVYGLYSY